MHTSAPAAVFEAEESAKIPAWFQRALDVPSEARDVMVDGCAIHYVTWGELGKPGIVLLHGSNAHLEWWRMVAPFLADHFRVAAMDFSGAGDSGWRTAYSGAQFAREVMAVARAAQLGDKPYVVGHSFGGFVTLDTGYLFGHELGGIITLDFTISSPAQVAEFAEFRRQRRAEPVRPTRIYPDRAAALARFRLMPEQTCQYPGIVAYVGAKGIRAVEDGWTWKFDPGMFKNLSMEEPDEPDRKTKLLNLACPVAMIMAEQSLDYSQDSLAYTRQLTDGVIPMLTIPNTQHHLMFDEPLAVTTAIKSLLLAWHLT
ncbi:MAG: alpha/beta hydrolase [Pseudomonadales bacterium]|nr:alpha/beta hydrolase [Pseudomonadales bacterium]MDP5058549.1 alpha/beta hydrolase [Pseudomonadales bacterium]